MERIVGIDQDLHEALAAFASESSGQASSNARIFLSAWDDAEKAIDDADRNLGDMLNKALEDFQLYDLYNRESDRTVRKAKLENLGELVSVLSEAGCGRSALSAFLEKLTLDSTTLGDHDPRDDEGVTLMTMHNTKGLEFRRVFVVGVEDEIIPGRLSDSMKDVEEERRIMYVAMTRAKESLYLSFVGSRMMWGRNEYHIPSRFLSEIPERMLSGDVAYTKGRPSIQASGYVGSRIEHRSYSQSVENKPAWASGIAIRKGGSSQAPKRPEVNKAFTFNAGDRVQSSNYGEGVIRDIEEKANGNRVLVIDFPGRTAKFIEAYAALEKVDG